MKRVSNGRSRGISGGGFRGSRGSSIGRSSGSSRYRSGSFLGSSRHYRSYGSGRYRLWNSLPWWGRIIYVAIILIILVAINWY